MLNYLNLVMKKISFWAKAHIWQSRLIIIISFILLNIVGVFIGELLNDLHVNIQTLYFEISVILVLILCIAYPVQNVSRRYPSYHSSYAQRKLCDFFLGAITLFMTVYIGNHWKDYPVNNEQVQAFNIVRHPADSVSNQNLLIKNFIKLIKNPDVTKLSKREKMLLIKNQIKTIKHSKELSKGEKIALIILSVVVAIFLLFGVLALSCSLSCSGSDALAIIVGLGGTFAIIFLLVIILKRINHGRKKKSNEPNT